MAAALTHFADQAVYATVPIVEFEALGPSIFRIRFECPQLARRIRPGQFLMVRLNGTDDPLIGRPFALFDTDAEFRAVDIVFVVGGNLTRRLAERGTRGQLDIWGPLGNGFSLRAAAHVILVGGGIGYTPFLAVAKQYLGIQQYGEPPDNPTNRSGDARQRPKVTFCFGARTASELVSLAEFQAVGAEVITSTDDGSAGHHGLVTELLSDVLASSPVADRLILCCGPEPMMEAVTEIAGQHQVACEVSLETPMACGIGICFTCVARIRDASGAWDYRRTCVEGPVFDANVVVW